MQVKITSEISGWRGQEGEFIRKEGDDAVVVRLAGNRLVQFKASDVSPRRATCSRPAPVEDEPKAEPDAE